MDDGWTGPQTRDAAFSTRAFPTRLSMETGGQSRDAEMQESSMTHAETEPIATLEVPADVQPQSRPSLALRGYQHEAIAAVLDAECRGVRRPLIALPTGTGKTVIFSHLITQRPGRSLILVHRDE